MSVDKRQQRAKAKRLAKLLEAAPEGKAGEGVLSPPVMLLQPDFKAALTVWREVAPLIDQRALLIRDDRLLLAVFCCKFAAWAKAQIDLAENGEYFMIESTKGPKRPWRNPMQAVEKDALDRVLDLSGRFGLTTMDRARLFKAQREDPTAPLFERGSRGGQVGKDAAKADKALPEPKDSWDKLLNGPVGGPVN